MMKTKFKSYTIDGATITDIIKITLIKNQYPYQDNSRYNRNNKGACVLVPGSMTMCLRVCTCTLCLQDILKQELGSWDLEGVQM